MTVKRLLTAGAVVAGLFINQDVGAIALVDRDLAIYRSSSGIEVSLERIGGPVVTQPCG